MAAPDFYFAINATFRWIHENWGEEGLNAYWEAMGRERFAPETKRFAEGGLPAVEEYWRELFAEEPGGDVTVRLAEEAVVIEVKTCPAIKHLREHGREIMPMYCEHCEVVSRAMCEGAGIQVQVTGGAGHCRQTFRKAETP
jgi:hypothetical protein